MRDVRRSTASILLVIGVVVSMTSGRLGAQEVSLVSAAINRAVEKPAELIGKGDLEILYHQGTPEIVRREGGLALKDKLLVRSRKDPFSPKSVLLLSSFSSESDVQSFLNELRGEAARKVKLEEWLPVVDHHVFLDLALTETGDEDARARVREIIEAGELNSLIAVLKSMDFIEEKETLASLLLCLEDRRDALPGAPSGTGYYLRVCDVALAGYLRKYARGDDLEAGRRYTDSELAAHFDNLSKRFTEK